MSECVVRMKLPEHCFNCSKKVDPETRMCLLDGHLFEETLGRITYRRDENCPIICSLPEGHGRLVDADAMAEELYFDVENDWRALDDMDIVGNERTMLQFDKDCKQNCILYLSESPAIVPADTAEREE